MAKKAEKNVQMKKVTGVICMSMGLGMLITLIIPGWGYVVAAFLAIVGFWNLFM